MVVCSSEKIEISTYQVTREPTIAFHSVSPQFQPFNLLKTYPKCFLQLRGFGASIITVIEWMALAYNK